jgi:hypothetical protein
MLNILALFAFCGDDVAVQLLDSLCLLKVLQANAADFCLLTISRQAIIDALNNIVDVVIKDRPLETTLGSVAELF